MSRNRAICLSCGVIIESRTRHGFHSCKCPNESFVDGGHDYFRYGAVDLNLLLHLPDEIMPLRRKLNKSECSMLPLVSLARTQGRLAREPEDEPPHPEYNDDSDTRF